MCLLIAKQDCKSFCPSFQRGCIKIYQCWVLKSHKQQHKQCYTWLLRYAEIWLFLFFLATLQKKLESTQEELMRSQIRYQKEIEKLENQNRELRKQLMLRGNMTLKQQRKIKKSLIDMYSEVLDQLSGMWSFVKKTFSISPFWMNLSKNLLIK